VSLARSYGTLTCYGQNDDDVTDMFLSLPCRCWFDSCCCYNSIDGNCCSSKQQARTQKMSSMFVRLSSPLYIHACTRLPLLPTPPLHSYATEKKREGKRKREETSIKEKKAVVLSFALSCSAVLFLVPCFTVALRWVPRPPGASSSSAGSSSNRD
jgi:hypothetical protein